MKLLGNMFFIKEKLEAENMISYVVEFNREHFIYKAHFPDNPITPGVCIIQAAGELLSEMLGKEVSLETLNNVKFIQVISPEENAEVVYEFSLPAIVGDNAKVKLSVKNDKGIFSKLVLTYNI